jgi:malonyl-CoA O-methyltransferase
MKIVEEFSKFAYEYNRYNVIQKEVARKLVNNLNSSSYDKVLDIGSGDGEVYKNLKNHNIEFNEFVALDFSKEMLDIHPAAKKIKKLCLDFNQMDISTLSNDKSFDLIISSSALQWSTNLFSVLSAIAQFSAPCYLSLFTSNTFKSLHRTINISSPIYSKEKIVEELDKLFIYEKEVERYTLHFNSVHEMLRYIKKSGVSGGVRQLSYSEMKNLMRAYPLDYLEFEVLFIKVLKRK